MMKIEKLLTTPDRVNRYRVDFSDGRVMRLYRQTIEDFGLYTGMELSPEEFAALEQQAGEMSAKMRAMRIITASDVSQKDLESRLIQKGERPENAHNAVKWLQELSLLDDRKTAHQIVSRCISRGYGLARVKQALFEKRIPKELWEEALADYPVQQDKISQFLQSRLDENSDQKEIRRAIDSLLRKGHRYGDIRRALDQLSFDTDNLPEE